jgi:hypothetical protein
MGREWKEYINGVVSIILGLGVTGKCFGDDPATKRLDAAITALGSKISRVNDMQDLRRNLQQLEKNLRQCIGVSSIPAQTSTFQRTATMAILGFSQKRSTSKSLDPDTINTHLRTKLRQSRLHHGANFELHQKNDVGAPAPRTPFKLQEGASGEDIIRQQWKQGLDPIRISVHSSVVTSVDQGAYPPLDHYDTQGRNIRIDAHCLALLQASLRANLYVFDPRDLVDQLTDSQKCNVIRALAYAQPNFSQSITIRKLLPGEVLTRCAQRHTIEPGSW